MSDVAAYHVFVCALFPVQGGVWTGIGSPHTSLQSAVDGWTASFFMVQTDTETWKVFSFLPSLCCLHTITSDTTKWIYTVFLVASICIWFMQNFVKNQSS